ncbi:MAG TPA: sigma-70 family RNA polymerase sigma factor [Planctomycetota bacterium]|nr:sigma-70 family RNA polymerase sigma factor [Planctomycetota bacterium]
MTPDVPGDTLSRARMGDRDAFRQVLESVQKLAYNIAYRLTWNASDAEDATQEVFLRLFRNFPQYDPALPFLPWFRRLATNCVLNWKEKRRPTSELPDQIAVPESAPVDSSERLHQAIRELPREYQACVTLKYLEDLGVGEIAQILQVPVGTVKTWLFRARELLMQKLKPHVETLL